MAATGSAGSGSHHSRHKRRQEALPPSPFATHQPTGAPQQEQDFWPEGHEEVRSSRDGSTGSRGSRGSSSITAAPEKADQVVPAPASTPGEIHPASHGPHCLPQQQHPSALLKAAQVFGCTWQTSTGTQPASGLCLSNPAEHVVMSSSQALMLKPSQGLSHLLRALPAQQRRPQQTPALLEPCPRPVHQSSRGAHSGAKQQQPNLFPKCHF